MHSQAVKITLTNEQQPFKAVAALVQGGWEDLCQHVGELHPKERAVLDGYPHERRKKSYLLGRLTAKKAIASLAGIDRLSSIWVDVGVFQFPVVRGENLQNIQVSISHCDDIGFGMAYPEGHPMGVDVEKVSEANAAIVARKLTDREKTLLAEQTPAVNHITIFSTKEALSKILRTGMTLDFGLLEIGSVKSKGDIVECDFRNFRQYKAFARRKEDYVFSVVLPESTTVDLDPIWQMLGFL
jgi:4'-phosphopantetheinyl transferase